MTAIAYRKPEAICDVLPGIEELTSPEQIALFIREHKGQIEQRIAALGLHLRLATQDDIEGIRQLQLKCFPPGATLEDAYVLFRIVTFGYAPVIETTDGTIVACNICEGYNDSQRTAWGIRVTVDSCVSKHNLGAELATYTSLIGMERGSRVRRAFVAPTNLKSAANILNYVGYTGEQFDLNIPGHGPRFIVSLPLTPAGVRNNRISPEKTLAFLDSHQLGVDFALVACADVVGISEMYRQTRFRVVGLLRAGFYRQEPCFLAFPEDDLRISN